MKRLDHDRIDRLVREGLKVAEISAITGASKSTVVNARKRLGVTNRTYVRLTEEEQARALAMLQDGANYCEVARTLGRDEMTFRNRFPGYAWTRQEVGRYSQMVRRAAL